MQEHLDKVLELLKVLHEAKFQKKAGKIKSLKEKMSG